MDAQLGIHPAPLESAPRGGNFEGSRRRGGGRAACLAGSQSLRPAVPGAAFSARPGAVVTQWGLEQVSHIGKLRDFLLEHRKDYVNASSHVMSEHGRMTDTERDQIDQDAQTFMRTCSEAIQQLRTQGDAARRALAAQWAAALGPEGVWPHEARSDSGSPRRPVGSPCGRTGRCWGLGAGDAACAGLQASAAVAPGRGLTRAHGARPPSVGTELALLSFRSKLEPEPNTRTREPGSAERVPESPSKDPEEKSVAGDHPAGEVRRQGPTTCGAPRWRGGSRGGVHTDARWTLGLSLSVPSRAVCFQFEQENQRLIGEMNSLCDEEAEIDSIHQLVVGATENIKEGNEDIREAIKNNAGFRVWVLFFLVMCSFSLLFLDWYDS
ncbi:PREDICTED: syntaxin-18 [Condylura cristata]|uniref:syntaxin-18 n=1 Tax=Condylura cristata TaxID=143302 RepID=UPI000642C935|nr:PREDICTED: syntaxin-18 [Condylura cristata]